MSRLLFIGVVGLLGLAVCVPAAEFNSLFADRAASERVYYNHRIGEKMPFEQGIASRFVNRNSQFVISKLPARP